MKAFAITWRGLAGLFDELFLYIFLSVLWWVGVILVLPAGPVTLALHNVANRTANYKRVDMSLFWGSLRKNIGASWLLFGGSLVAIVGLLANIWFYGVRSGWFFVIAIAWAWVLLIVLMAGQFFFPLFWQQADRRLILIVRNAVIMAFRYPLFSLLLMILQLILFAVSIVIPIFVVLIAPALIALIANFGMVHILQDMDMAPPPPYQSN